MFLWSPDFLVILARGKGTLSALTLGFLEVSFGFLSTEHERGGQSGGQSGGMYLYSQYLRGEFAESLS